MGNMQEMLRNPAVAQMVENPEFLRSIIESNPQLNQMMRQNPELAQAMRDPETLRTAMRAAMDPSYMQQMLRNQDAQMAHIQNMPGGLDALRRMQQEYQEPMENAMQDTVEQLTGARSGQEEEDNSNQGNDPSQPLPNPWGGGSTRSTQGACFLIVDLGSRATEPEAVFTFRFCFCFSALPIPLHFVHEIRFLVCRIYDIYMVLYVFCSSTALWRWKPNGWDGWDESVCSDGWHGGSRWCRYAVGIWYAAKSANAANGDSNDEQSRDVEHDGATESHVTPAVEFSTWYEGNDAKPANVG